jgi:peptidase A4-like protein
MHANVVAGTALAVLLCALPAHANNRNDPIWTTDGWAGYVVRNTGASFTEVRGSWRQPHVVCNRLDTSISFWVGLGGAGPGSKALEQIGTSADCDGRGARSSSAWYQLFPSPPVDVPVAIRAGDVVTASVAVSGTTVEVGLTNRTTHVSFSTRRMALAPEADSAEWIVEAPAACFVACTTLPLPDTGAVRFADGWTSVEDYAGPIGYGAWTRTRLELAAGGASARASALSRGGSSFVVVVRR